MIAVNPEAPKDDNEKLPKAGGYDGFPMDERHEPSIPPREETARRPGLGDIRIEEIPGRRMVKLYADEPVAVWLAQFMAAKKINYVESELDQNQIVISLSAGKYDALRAEAIKTDEQTKHLFPPTDPLLADLFPARKMEITGTAHSGP